MLKNNLWLISIRQAFLNLLPYFILIGFTILLYQILLVLNLQNNLLFELLSKILFLYSFTTPIAISIAVAYFLAKNFDLHRVALASLTFLLFVAFAWRYKSDELVNINVNLNFLMIVVPIVAVSLYKKVFLWVENFFSVESLNEELKEIFLTIFPFIVTFFGCGLLIQFVIDTTTFLLTHSLAYEVAQLPLVLSAILSLSIASFIWWFTGIHGTNLVISIFGEEYLKQPLVGNVDASVFINNFVIYGGDGSTLALLLAILLFATNPFLRKIAWISLPFAIFNINEIVLFALPIILNIRLLFPFLAVPLANFFIGYLFFYFFPLEGVHQAISWITPIFISGYLLDQSFLHVMLQCTQLAIGILIYLPFMQKYQHSLDESETFDKFKNSLGIQEHVEKNMHLNFIKTQQDIINEEKEIAKLTKELSSGTFLLYYQPKVNIKKNECVGYEALLRFSKDGRITGPYFIDKIEQIGFEKIIDFWVINQLQKDFEKWALEGFYPKISINISPASICDPQVIDKIITELGGQNVEIEILERTFAHEMKLFLGNIEHLKDHGFSISVDDFGTGFSSLQYLNILPAKTIKFDRTLILNTKSESGAILYKSIASMCKAQGFELIAEGVETQEEMAIVKEAGIEIVQGFYYSRALPLDTIQSFEKSLKKDHNESND